MDRWLYAVTFVGSVTYAVLRIARAASATTGKHTRARMHARPMTRRERNARRQA